MGRPRIPIETIELIDELHKQNPITSPEKLNEQLKLRGVINTPAPNTIEKYIKKMANKPKRPSVKQKQSWKTFITNHLAVTWAVDFFTIQTFNFKILHVLSSFITIQEGLFTSMLQRIQIQNGVYNSLEIQLFMVKSLSI